MRKFFFSAVFLVCSYGVGFAATIDVSLEFSEFIVSDLRRGTTPPERPPIETVYISFRIDFDTPSVLNEAVNVEYIELLSTNLPFDGQLTYLVGSGFDPSGATAPLIGSTINGVQIPGDRFYSSSDFIIPFVFFQGFEPIKVSNLTYQLTDVNARFQSTSQVILGHQVIAPVPLPASAGFLAFSLLGLFGLRRVTLTSK